MAGVSNLMKTSWCLHRKKINTEWRGEGWEQVLTFTVQWQRATRFAGAQQGTCCFHLNSPNSQVTGYKPDAFMVMYIQWTPYSYIWSSLLSLLRLPFPSWIQICRWATTGPNKGAWPHAEPRMHSKGRFLCSGQTAPGFLPPYCWPQDRSAFQPLLQDWGAI